MFSTADLRVILRFISSYIWSKCCPHPCMTIITLFNTDLAEIKDLALTYYSYIMTYDIYLIY